MPTSLSLLSSAINEAIASDAANRRYLSSLGNICLHIVSESPQISLCANIEDGEVRLSSLNTGFGDDSPGDIVIQGTALNLAKLILSPVNNAAALRSANVRVEGDVALLLELTQISEKIEIDWEALLAEKLGDTPAVIFSRGFSATKETSAALLEAQQKRLESWLKQPNSPLPTREEYDQMKSSLRQLQYRLDRLDVRLRESDRLGHTAGNS